MLTPIKVAFGGVIGEFYASLVPVPASLQEFISRGLAKAVAWAPSRMVDAAEEMLAAWQRNDTDGAPTQPAKLPVILVAMSKDSMPTGRDYTRQIADPVPIIMTDDPDERVFEVRTIATDIRAQIVIFAHDEPTAGSIAKQLALYLDAVDSRTFYAEYAHAGMTEAWPVHIQLPDSPGQSVATDVKNLTILAIDLTLQATIPLYTAPADTAPNDGQGTDGDPSDPHGYPVVTDDAVIAAEIVA